MITNIGKFPVDVFLWIFFKDHTYLYIIHTYYLYIRVVK